MFRRKPRVPAVRTRDISSGSFVQEIDQTTEQEALCRKLAGRAGRRKIQVCLRPEPAGHDAPGVLAVVAVDGDAEIGTLPAEVTAEFGPQLARLRRDENREVVCRAFLVAGQGDPDRLDANLDCDFDRLNPDRAAWPAA